MRIIPKTLKEKEKIRNHITKEIFIAGTFLLVATLMLTFYIVHPFFKIPFFIITVAVLWFSAFPSRWNKDVTRAEMFFKFLLAYRHNSYELDREEVAYAIKYYRQQAEESELEKARKKNAKRTF